LSEADVDEILGEIRTALLEADVNVGVVRSVLARIRDKAVGAEMSKALDPAQQVVKTVHAELIGLLGGETLKITYASQPPTRSIVPRIVTIRRLITQSANIWSQISRVILLSVRNEAVIVV
jgi:signal recognition particle GTPase